MQTIHRVTSRRSAKLHFVAVSENRELQYPPEKLNCLCSPLKTRIRFTVLVCLTPFLTAGRLTMRSGSLFLFSTVVPTSGTSPDVINAE